MDGLYRLTIRQRGQDISAIPITLRTAYVFSGTIGPAVQAFFAKRVAKCFDRPYLAIVCWTMIFIRLISSMWLTALSLNRLTMALFEAKWKWVLTAGLILEAFVDLLIAASLCYFLLKSRRQSVHARTIRLLDKLIAMTIPTGLFTSFMAIMMLVCFMTMPKNFVWLALMMCQAKLFSNSMLASLNGRSMLRDDQEEDTDLPGNVRRKPAIPGHNSVELSTHINIRSFPADEAVDTENDTTLTSP